MSTIAENLQKLITAKTNIRNAILDMGGTCPSDHGFEDFDDDIDSIPSGSSSSSSSDPGTCLTFKGTASFTLKTYRSSKSWDGTLAYSTDGSTWTTWIGVSIASSSTEPYVLYLRGTGNTYITGSSTTSITKSFQFTTTGTINCIGRIDTLLDYQTVQNGGTPTMASYCYANMFYNCTSLTSAPALPATTLTSHCYDGMFTLCKSLTSIPALPATTLADYCYSSMFNTCKSLTSAPALPATTLKSHCYESMFNDCTSLLYPPALPATNLAEYCYAHMFEGCSNLITCPRLPATVLKTYCYQNMFKGCIKLVNLPQIICIPSSTISNALMDMFEGCSLIKLSTTKSSTYDKEFIIKPTTTTTTTATISNMFKDTGGSYKGNASYNTTYYTSNVVV